MIYDGIPKRDSDMESYYDNPWGLLCDSERVREENQREVSRCLSEFSDSDVELLHRGNYEMAIRSHEAKQWKARSSMITCPIYRGQVNSDWLHVSKASRILKDKQDENQKNAIRVCMRCKQLILNQLIVSTEAYRSNYGYITRGLDSEEREHLVSIDHRFIAQHYLISTDVVDYTSNPYVAMFFACTVRKDDGTYRPLSDDDLRACPCGSIFISRFSLREDPNEKGGGPRVIDPCIVSRPSAQSGFVMPDDHDEDVPIKKITFRHDCEFSKWIFDMFEGGKVLFGDERDKAIENVAREIEESNNIPMRCLQYVAALMHLNPSPIILELKKQGYTFQDVDLSGPRDKIETALSRFDVEYCKSESLIEKCRNGYVLSGDEFYELLSMLNFRRTVNDDQLKACSGTHL